MKCLCNGRKNIACGKRHERNKVTTVIQLLDLMTGPFNRGVRVQSSVCVWDIKLVHSVFSAVPISIHQSSS